MTLTERIDYFTYVFDLLQSTDSRIEKVNIIKDIPNELTDDFKYILETLNGQHKIGYKYTILYNFAKMPEQLEKLSVKEYLQPLFKPLLFNDLRDVTILKAMEEVKWKPTFVGPIVNRTLKLGIGNSLIDKPASKPMLAKKYEGKIKDDAYGYYITEKLDGNRCIAKWNGLEWEFLSRNGKKMYVNIDMGNLDKSYTYDGEILSLEQSIQSARRNLYETLDGFNEIANKQFNITSGYINKHNLNKKNLVYNIFDIQLPNYVYKDRRELLNLQLKNTTSHEIRILPVLARITSKSNFDNDVNKLLDRITDTGGEGLMINTGSGMYSSTRVDDLLKVKKVSTMDMKVVDWEYGTGKNKFFIGSLICECTLPDGRKVSCKVGSGLTDEQRIEWTRKPDKILGKIVEIAYFSLSQNKSTDGTMLYSMRFPRLKSIRTDKIETSSY